MAAPAASVARPRRTASNRFPQRAPTDDDRGAASDDSFDSGSEIDQDDTADFAAPGGSKKPKRPRVPKTKQTKATKAAAATRPKKSKAATSGAGGAKKKQAGGSKGATRSAARKEELDINEDVPLFSEYRELAPRSWLCPVLTPASSSSRPPRRRQEPRDCLADDGRGLGRRVPKQPWTSID